MKRFKGKGKLVGRHLLQKIGARGKLEYPGEYRKERKDCKDLTPYLQKSLKHVNGIMKAFEQQQKAIQGYVAFLKQQCKEKEAKFPVEMGETIEKLSSTLEEIPRQQKGLMQELRGAFIPNMHRLKQDIEKSTKSHNTFKVKLSNFQRLDRSNAVLRKKLTGNPQQQAIVKRIQHNLLEMEKQQSEIDDAFHEANADLKGVSHRRDTEHIGGIMGLLTAMYLYYEDGIRVIDKVKPWMEKEVENIEQVRESYHPPERLETHGTWEISEFDPEQFTEAVTTKKKKGDVPKVPIGTCKAKYDFSPKEKGELSFKKGEKIYVLVCNPDDWSTGINESGQVGEFPWNYVNEMIKAEKTKALYLYEASEDNELSFKEGDLITVLHKESDGCCFTTPNGLEIGTFPCNYCELGKSVQL